jgi:diguanylate cyclase (GGDEF)-like protein
LEAVVKERTRELEADKIELIEAKAALGEQASRDFLTGLLNRGAILRALEQEMRRSQRERSPFAVVLIDLDHFKDVNDSHGQLVGDEVLREFARRVNSCLRPYDHVGRFGGEEFLILLPGMKDESAERIDELHRQITQDPFMCGDTELRISCSFGVAWFRSELITTEALLDLADQALYAAKALGQNRVEAVGLPSGIAVTPQP